MKQPLTYLLLILASACSAKHKTHGVSDAGLTRTGDGGSPDGAFDTGNSHAADGGGHGAMANSAACVGAAGLRQANRPSQAGAGRHVHHVGSLRLDEQT